MYHSMVVFLFCPLYNCQPVGLLSSLPSWSSLRYVLVHLITSLHHHIITSSSCVILPHHCHYHYYFIKYFVHLHISCYSNYCTTPHLIPDQPHSVQPLPCWGPSFPGGHPVALQGASGHCPPRGWCLLQASHLIGRHCVWIPKVSFQNNSSQGAKPLPQSHTPLVHSLP